ncbi:hypothetical protein PNP85_15720, partial [Halobacterium salinarum]|uniref:hypothetical protein n=1 Tax=Halobacterium salinarum TaxID=2242 RepID=UPI0025574E15
CHSSGTPAYGRPLDASEIVFLWWLSFLDRISDRHGILFGATGRRFHSSKGVLREALGYSKLIDWLVRS